MWNFGEVRSRAAGAILACGLARDPRSRGATGQKMAVDLSMPVLVVDDYNTMIRIIRNLLRQLGFADIDDAHDGTEALSKMQTQALRPCDLRLEHGADDGLRPLAKGPLRSPASARTPFIMITAESKTDNVIAAKKAGVNNYIVKPFNAQTLKAKIDAVFVRPKKPRNAARRPRRDASPHQTARDGFRRNAGRRKNLVQHLAVRRFAVAELFGVDSGGDEQAIEPECGSA